MPIGLADSAIVVGIGGGLRVGDGGVVCSDGVSNAPGMRSVSVFALVSVLAFTETPAIAVSGKFVFIEISRGVPEAQS